MRGRASTWGVTLIVCGLLALFAFRLVDSANRNALTFDEPHYVGAGLYLWDSGDYDFARSLYYHPPLAFHVASLPLLFVETPEPPLTRDVGRQLLSGTEPSPERVRALSRLPFVFLACWGALLVFLWAREWAGTGAGLFALALFTVSPVMLAHSFLAHSDITVTVFFIQTLYTFWRWSDRRTFVRFLLCGLSLGLALIAKLSGLILLPTLALLLWTREVGVWPFDQKVTAEGHAPPASGGFWRSSFRAAGLWVDLLLVAVLVIWIGYGFSFASQEVSDGLFE
ncbi:MAG: phospholipid carrier-dependent glycosyltransferase, partial [Myxococcota bacterium]|nr:phospholipid carrier-dependent glycosyltransferase [Myxococcota bacterium]